MEKRRVNVGESGIESTTEAKNAGLLRKTAAGIGNVIQGTRNKIGNISKRAGQAAVFASAAVLAAADKSDVDAATIIEGRFVPGGEVSEPDDHVVAISTEGVFLNIGKSDDLSGMPLKGVLIKRNTPDLVLDYSLNFSPGINFSILQPDSNFNDGITSSVMMGKGSINNQETFQIGMGVERPGVGAGELNDYLSDSEVYFSFEEANNPDVQPATVEEFMNQYQTLYRAVLPGNVQLDDAMLFLASSAQPGLAGDFDEDGDVDGNDFLNWQRGLGTDYDAADLDDWKQNFGSQPAVLPANTAAVGGVPEPSSGAIASAAALAALAAAERQRRLKKKKQ